MGFQNLHQALRRLRAGVGQTTQENRVLPFPGPDIPIPARVGIGQAVPKEDQKPAAIRGFVITPFGSLDGIRFNPYTLDKLETHYQPESAPYAVMAWATDWNVIDTTHWNDVVCFYQDEIRINAEGMPALAIPVATLPGPAIPYVIPSTVPGSKYGDVTINASEKRVFAVGRDYVQSWGGGGVTVTLGPATPGKSMAIGQRIHPTANSAFIGKLHYTGTFWDSLGGTWQFSAAEVSMMLTAPYLQSVSSSALVDLPIASYGAPSSSTPTVNRGYSLPNTAVGLIGIGEVSHSGSIPNDINWNAIFPWRELFMAKRTGKEIGTSTVTNYSSSASHSGEYAGRAYSYACQNTKSITTENTSISFLADSYLTGAVLNGPTTGSGYRLVNSNNVLVWNDSNDGATDRGNASFSFPSGTISNSSISRTTEIQSISGSVICGSISLFALSISVIKGSGQQRQIAEDNSYYTSYLNNPYGQIGASGGMGMNSDVRLQDDTQLSYYKNPPGNWNAMPQAAKNEIVAKFDARIGQFSGKKCFDYEGSNGVFHTNFYTSTIQSNQNSYSASISLTTKDYLLYDETNGVYLWIESTLTGAQGSGAGTCTVTVTLKMQTRYGSSNQQLASRGYSGTILPEYPINPPATTPTAVPSPRFRAFFAPIHQEQGSFKGVSYVTAAEESNGATPVHLMNFRLKLRTYSDFSTLDAENQSGELVSFIPCNLLEMLYAYVYSADYGIGAATGERYQVTRSDRFDDLNTHLFSQTHEVHLRNSASGSWAGTLGGDTAGLYRT